MLRLSLMPIDRFDENNVSSVNLVRLRNFVWYEDKYSMNCNDLINQVASFVKYVITHYQRLTCFQDNRDFQFR